MSAPTLVFDLETVPDVGGLRRIHETDPALDDAAVAELAFARRREKTGSDFLPLHQHRIIAIGCLFRDTDGVRVKCLGEANESEASLLRKFFRTVDHYTPQLVSWNGGGFDLQVLHYRSLVHGIQAPRYWETGDDDREFRYNNYLSRYHSRHTDLMDLLALYNGRANAPLDELSRLCGFPGKLGMDGSQVWPQFLAGGIHDIRAYCETDVANTWLLYCRFQLIRGQFTRERYDSELRLLRETLQSTPGEHWKQFLSRWEDLPQ